MRSLFLAISLTAALLALPVLAQAPQGTPTRIRGTVESLDGNTLMVKGRDGADVKVALAPNVNVGTLVAKKLSDIKTGDFVASTGRKGDDGKLHAVEIRILPAALRSRIEGQTPWDLFPGSVMTNATVDGIATASNGTTFKVSYKGETTEYVVTPDTPITAQVPGTIAMLKPGTAVVVFALKKDDGTVTSANVVAETNGVKLAM